MLREKLETDGYVVLPGLFARDEVERLRAQVGDLLRRRSVVFHLGRTRPNAAAECPELSSLFADPRVVAAFRSVLGDDLVFTGHCDLHQDMFSTWHKDTGRNHGYFEEDCFTPECRIYKMAVYLQDHQDDDGLAIQPGSHRSATVATATGRRLRTQAGDAILFDIRATHQGRVPGRADRLIYNANVRVRRLLCRIFPQRVTSHDVPMFYSFKQLVDRVRGRPPRRSIFFTFGAANRLTAQFAEANMARQVRQLGASPFPAQLRAALEVQGVRLHGCAPPSSASLADAA